MKFAIASVIALLLISSTNALPTGDQKPKSNGEYKKALKHVGYGAAIGAAAGALAGGIYYGASKLHAKNKEKKNVAAGNFDAANSDVREPTPAVVGESIPAVVKEPITRSPSAPI